MVSANQTSLNVHFRTRDASALGITAHALRSDQFDSTFWGIRSHLAPTTTAEQCRALLSRMPHGTFVSHTTAALLHRMPLPWHLERSTDLHLSVPSPHRAPHATGIRGHRLTLGPGELDVRESVPVTSVERTWCDLATVLHFYDLVAAGDFLIHRRAPLTSVEKLRAAVERRAGGRGTRLLARSLLLLSDGSESPPESKLRVILAEAGAPAVRVNHVVTDLHGEFVARTDLVVEEWNLILEYQGDYHRTTKGQWRADMTRRSTLESLGRRVMELNADDLRDPSELMQRIRRRVGLPA